jgi:hypothetical protein
VCLVVALVVTALGAPVGLLWRLIAPEVELVQTDGGPVPVDSEPEGYIADDGWFMGIAVVAGILVAVAVWLLLRRYRGPAMLVAIAVGSIGAAVLAGWLGHQIGFAEFERLARDATPGTTLHRPPKLRIVDIGLWLGFIPRVRGIVLIQAIVAVAVYAAMAGLHYTPDLRAEDGQPGPAVDVPPVSWGWTEPQDPLAAPAPPAPYPAGPPPDAAAPVRRAGE